MAGQPIIVTAAYRVNPGQEPEFCSWAIALFRLAAELPGYLGGGVVSTVGPAAEWYIVYRFEDEATARSWEDSFTWQHWGARSALFTQEAADGRESGLKDWFEGPVRMLPPPAKWKLWFVNTGAVFPPVLIFNLLVIPYLAGVNFLVKTMALCIAVSAVVTWLVMPRLQKLLKKWLYPSVQSLGWKRRPMGSGAPLQDVRFSARSAPAGDPSGGGRVWSRRP